QNELQATDYLCRESKKEIEQNEGVITALKAELERYQRAVAALCQVEEKSNTLKKDLEKTKRELELKQDALNSAEQQLKTMQEESEKKEIGLLLSKNLEIEGFQENLRDAKCLDEMNKKELESIKKALSEETEKFKRLQRNFDEIKREKEEFDRT